MTQVFFTAVGLMFLAELGDKSQFLALGLSARYGAARVAVGLVLSTLTTMLLAVLVGQAVGSFIDPFIMGVVSGLIFIAFGLWTLFGTDDDDDDDDVGVGASGDDAPSRPLRSIAASPIVKSYATFFVAEFGDKTQLLALTLAASASPDALGQSPTTVTAVVTLGAALGMVLSSGIAIGIGAVLGKSIPRELVAKLSAGVFMTVGVWTLAATLLSGSGA